MQALVITLLRQSAWFSSAVWLTERVHRRCVDVI